MGNIKSILLSVLTELLLILPWLTSGVAFAQSDFKQFTIPLRFEVLGNGVEAPALELSYDLSAHHALRIGDLEVSPKTVFANLNWINKFDPNFTRILDNEKMSEVYLLFNWPDFLVPEGQIELIARSGRVLTKFEIDSVKIAKWKEQLEQWAKAMTQKGLPFRSVVARSTWGQVLTASQLDSLVEPFKICISKSDENGFHRLCSLMYDLKSSRQGYRLTIHPVTAAPARALVGNEIAPLKNTVEVRKEQKVQFYAEVSSGISYEFVTFPVQLNLSELVKNKDGKTATLTGWGEKPIQQYKQLNPMSENLLAYLWSNTIGDLRQFWSTTFDLNKSEIYFQGKSGGVFRQRFIISKLPSEDIRPYLHYRTIDGTYINGADLYGQKAKNLGIRSKENKIIVEKNNIDFTWEFQAQKRGEINKSILLVKDGVNEFKAYHELYKGYPRELSGRFSGITTPEGKLAILGEFAFNYWFEDVLGWNNYWLARQRWGLSTKYFRSLIDIPYAYYSGVMSVATVDLKYRFKPGLWNRDESWGAILSYQKFNWAENRFDNSFLGAGVFWARSMPKALDEVFNLFWLMRYPKWVDVEFITYMASGEKYTKVNFPTSALNFHGKVMWTNTFFGEAGFGVKNYNFIDASIPYNSITKDKTTGLQSMKFATFYGTVGLGINF